MRFIRVENARPNAENYRNLEEGNVLFFPRTPFEISREERDILCNARQTPGAHHKNIAFRPAQGRITGIQGSGREADEFRMALSAYSERAIQFLRDFLPRYMERCRIDFTSFRPEEEEGRSLPTNKRNDLLHVDAFPSRPTGGDLIMRIFTNVNPVKSRVWLISEPFARTARDHARSAGLAKTASGNGWLHWSSKLFATKRTPYDRFMLGFHDYLKRNEEYQRTCPKYRLEFPPDSTWIVFTDVVPHAVLSGRYALEQTVIVPRDSLLDRGKAPIEILQALCQRPLAASA